MTSALPTLRRASLCAAAALCALAGCSRPETGADGGGETVLRISIEAVNSTDPIAESSVYSAKAVLLLYETLLSVDYYARPYTLRPGLCNLPEISPDGLVYTFRLVDGPRFCADECFGTGPDGSPRDREVTAFDIAYSFERLKDPANASGGKWIAADIDRIETPDAKTVRMTLKRPVHHFLWLMAMSNGAAVPREAVEKYGSDFGSHPVGSGPYRLEKWRRNHSMTFRRRPEWHGWRDGTACTRDAAGEIACPGEGRPFDRIEYLSVSDATTQLLLLMNGEIDMMRKISNDAWEAIVEADGDISPELKSKGVGLHSLVSMETAYVGFNMADPVVGANRALRQALSCAFDFERWRKMQNNRVSEANGPVPECVPEDRIDTPSPWRTDVEKAKRLLAEAGYPGGKDPATGRRLVLTVSMNSSQEAKQNYEILAAMFDEIGVRLEPDFLTWTAFLKSTSERRSQMFAMGWVGDYPDVENFMMLFYGPNAAPGPNRCNMDSPEFNAAYEAALAATDPAARRAAWLRAQEIVREECPWLVTGYPKSFVLLRTRVSGYCISDFPYGEEIHFRAKPAPETEDR